MTREESELSESEHYAQFEPEPGVDEQGYYPGQKAWEDKHQDIVKARDLADAKALKQAEEALLAEVAADLKDHPMSRSSGSRPGVNPR